VESRKLKVRELRQADKFRAAEIDRLATRDLRKVYRPTDKALRKRSTLIPALQRLVAEIDERVVGVVQYRIAGTRLSLLGLGVDPAARRRGVAAALVRHLECIARDRGCTTMALHTVRETENVPIFERLGFAVASEEPTDLFVSERFSELIEVVMLKRVGQTTQGS
jgi:GNAT superfamily N-acetyltransferase